MSNPPTFPTEGISFSACPRCDADLGKSSAERLFIVDVDGTLVRRDGSIDARDHEAIRSLSSSGTIVALATGRLAVGALRAAREIGIRTPLICADGGVIVCGTCERPIYRRGLEATLVTSAMDRFQRAGLAVFPFFADAVRYDASHRHHLRYLGLWSEGSAAHPSPLATVHDEEVIALLGMGPREHVERLSHELEVPVESVDLDTFELSPDRTWAVRLRSRGAHKGAAALVLRRWLGLERAQVAAIGDGHNDLPLFAEVGRSFAMAHAPEVVRLAATDVVAATLESGGGVAEAAARWRNR